MEHGTIALLMFALATGLFMLGVPIILCMALWVTGVLHFTDVIPLANIGQSAFFGLKYFSLLALPLFILTGDLVNAGGIARRLIAFASAALHRLPGKMSVSAIAACGMFAAISGSNSATTATIGRVIIPEMVRRKYPLEYAAAIAASGGVVGVVIPPSLIFIIYGVLMNLSPGDLFIAGIIPGILMVLVMISIACVVAKRNGWDTTAEESSRTTILRAAWHAQIGFIAMVIAVGGIYAGIFSPTEGAGVAVAYCLLAGLFITRELKFRSLFGVLFTSASITGLIAPIVAVSITVQETLSVVGLPQIVSELMSDVATSSWAVTLLAMAIIMIGGCVLESVPVVIIFAPILAPIAADAGLDPIHFAVMFVVGSAIGFITPPYGLNLYVAAGISRAAIFSIAYRILPYLLGLFLVWLVIAFVPQLSLFLVG